MTSKALWSIRPCAKCGKGVKCEPGYPLNIKVMCAECIASGTNEAS